MMNMRYWSCLGFLLILLSGCGGRESLAPVVQLHWRDGNRYDRQYVVRRGDTLYAIAFRYDRDYRQLAAENHIYPPYSLRVGQIIYLQPRMIRARIKKSIPYARPSNATTSRYIPPAVASGRNKQWLWPAHGRIVTSFVPDQGKKGLDIAGKKGDKIYASAAGTVAYAGSGLTGYGNLIIIKHDNQFLTAYGNNARNLVHEGQMIRAGQMIAEMGLVDRRFWGVHFEIRHAGKPVNPRYYLGSY
jgi:lipoprotein NlpD